MNAWIFAQVLVTLFVLASAEEPGAEPDREVCSTTETCQAAYECKAAHWQMKRDEKKQCMETCATDSMVQHCLPERPDMSALKTCLDTTVCSADNLANAENNEGGKWGNRFNRQKRGLGGKMKHGCRGKVQFLRKMLEKTGEELSEKVDTFLTCVEGCSSCDEEEEEEEEEEEDKPCADQCKIKKLLYPAMKTCQEDPAVKAAKEAHEKPDMLETCKCFAIGLGADTTICDTLAEMRNKWRERKGGKRAGGKKGPRGKKGGI